MTRRGWTLATAALLVAAWFTIVGTTAQVEAADNGYPAGRNDLFYNYYVGPGNCCGGVPAKLYIAPRPTPPWVGHTYHTYPPLMPHEFLYKHSRRYNRYHSDGGFTRTRVSWHGPIGAALHWPLFAL